MVSPIKRSVQTRPHDLACAAVCFQNIRKLRLIYRRHCVKRRFNEVGDLANADFIAQEGGDRLLVRAVHYRAADIAGGSALFCNLQAAENLFIGLGNYLPRVKQNYTFGVKTPWALDDPDNWRRTQRFGGVCFVAMGLVLVALGFLGPALTREAAVAVLLAVVLLPCVAMYVYSYLLWRRRAAR